MEGALGLHMAMQPPARAWGRFTEFLADVVALAAEGHEPEVIVAEVNDRMRAAALTNLGQDIPLLSMVSIGPLLLDLAEPIAWQKSQVRRRKAEEAKQVELNEFWKQQAALRREAWEKELEATRRLTAENDRRWRETQEKRAATRVAKPKPQQQPTMTMEERAERKREKVTKALLLRLEGKKIREIAVEFGVSVARARQLVGAGQRLDDRRRRMWFKGLLSQKRRTILSRPLPLADSHGGEWMAYTLGDGQP
jgi:hypothetical protein